MDAIEQANAASRFTCPVQWCAGYVPDHGGDGAEPGDWVHTGADERLPAGAVGYPAQQSGGALEYGIVLAGAELGHTHGADALAVFAGELRALAGVLDRRAGQIRRGWIS
jgi:hypothetical protein